MGRRKRSNFLVCLYKRGALDVEAGFATLRGALGFVKSNVSLYHTLGVIKRKGARGYRVLARYIAGSNGYAKRVRVAKTSRTAYKKMSGFAGRFVKGRKRKKRSDAGKKRIGKKRSDAMRARGRRINRKLYGANARSIKYSPKYRKRKEFVHRSRGSKGRLIQYMREDGVMVKARVL